MDAIAFVVASENTFGYAGTSSTTASGRSVLWLSGNQFGFAAPYFANTIAPGSTSTYADNTGNPESTGKLPTSSLKF